MDAPILKPEANSIFKHLQIKLLFPTMNVVGETNNS